MKMAYKEFGALNKISKDISEKEIKAADAERASKKFKQVEYMAGFVGKEFEGVITGVTEWGIYIEELNTKCEGMARLKDLEDDFYELDPKQYAIIGSKTKKKYTLGDKVRFKVTKADVEQKTLDYKLM
jgi:ribonuclease R